MIRTKSVCIAAYIKLQLPVIKHVGNYFYFESGKDIDQWKIEYYNSCCCKFFSEITKLKRLKQ